MLVPARVRRFSPPPNSDFILLLILSMRGDEEGRCCCCPGGMEGSSSESRTRSRLLRREGLNGKHSSVSDGRSNELDHCLCCRYRERRAVVLRGKLAVVAALAQWRASNVIVCFAEQLGDWRSSFLPSIHSTPKPYTHTKQPPLTMDRTSSFSE